ncbi:MAG TPA: prepilin-type N-terminal cleavage/methylation domain-containing protein [Ilumatobacteraceae bacterium]|jgi:prepilin-type N-terminal cleavage/methylation domain-containing protein
MNNNHHAGDHRKQRGDKGFTLIEILIAIVLVGILSAVAVVGISNLTSKGAKSACSASLDAAKAASVVYFTSNGAYPTTLTQMTTAQPNVPAPFSLPSGVTINAAAVGAPYPAAANMQAKSGTSWYLTMTAGAGGAAPTFVCQP